MAGLGAQGRAADEPARPKAGLSRQDALERFRKMSPEERLQQAEKVAGGAKAFVPVTRGDLDLTVVERGALDAIDASDVICRVKARSANSTVASTIKWVIDDGTVVKKGDRLVEVDDSELRDHLRDKKIDLAMATANKVYAEDQRKIARKQNQLDTRRAEIDLKQGKRNLKKFRGKDADEKEALEDVVELAQLSLELVKLQSKAKEAVTAADLKAKIALEEAEAKRLREIEAEIAACVIKAPQAGLVAYYVPEAAWGRNALIVAQGEPVREGQKLMRVYGLERFAVTTRVPEALIAHVRVGQKATVRVDAFPTQLLRGRVKTIAARAAHRDWLSAGVKVYPVVVELLDQPPGLKPGMSADARIDAGLRPNVLRVPVAAVLRSGRETFCYVKVGKKELQERKVKTGARNNVDVEVKEGLKDGELVLRSVQTIAGPPARPKAKGARRP